jgi:DNA-directed RNA polymerase beta subunit
MAVKHLGEQLLRAGYNYYGNEPMYSGIFGTEFYCDIYVGVVYYQRLRHMVKDKYQVRATGPNNALTRQPVKGRKLGGGIRLGEMERDSLLAHGGAFLIRDRLMNSSDRHRAFVCAQCGSVLTAQVEYRESTSAHTHTLVRSLFDGNAADVLTGRSGTGRSGCCGVERVRRGSTCVCWSCPTSSGTCATRWRR